MAPFTSSWIKKAEAGTSFLDSLDDLNERRDQWVSDVLSSASCLDWSHSSLLLLAVNRPAALYNTTKEDLDQQITLVLSKGCEATIGTKARKHAVDAEITIDGWELDRKTKRWCKAGAGVQAAMSRTVDFLKAFSGLADMFKGSDQQCGSLAYGTYSLLLSFAALKANREDETDRTMRELARALLRMDVLQSVHPPDSLRALVVEAFALSILFCRETTQYFSRKSRVLQSPKALKMETAVRLRMTMSEIHKDIGVLMMKRVDEIQAQLGQMQIEGTDTNRRVRHTRISTQKLDARANVLQRHRPKRKLIIGNTSKECNDLHTDLVHYQSALTSEKSHQGKRRVSARQMSWDVLREEPIWSGWEAQPNSGMLLLGGQNYSLSAQSDVSWLSQASLLMVQELHRRRSDELEVFRRSSTCVLYFLCQPHSRVTRASQCTFDAIICHLVFQLAEQHPDSLREVKHEIDDSLGSAKWNHNDPDVSFRAMTSLLIVLIAAFENDTQVTIFIDRLDGCAWGEDPMQEEEALAKAVWSLSNLITDVSLKHLHVKVLLVVDDIAVSKIRKMQREKDLTMQWKIDWDQEAE
ncbi:hypothetical protein LTR17_022427 [Elasticomyces elasticus]|nr:hypothetical protein LTR17_022427 [Elasticomyces elasticus]